MSVHQEEANVRTQEKEGGNPELTVDNNNVSTMESGFQVVEKKRSLVWPEFLTFDKTKSSDGKQRNTGKADCLKMHKTLKAQLKETLSKVSSRISLTLLNFTHIDSPHTGKTMYAAVLSMRQDWELEHDDDDVLRTMAIEMKSKFDMYWFNSEQDDYGMLFAFAMILDPRCKLSVLKFCYENIFGDVESTLRVSDLHLKLEKFYKLYAQTGTSSTLNNNTDEYDDKEASSSFHESLILDVYLEDPKLDRKAELDILAFWKENEHRYKGISHLARDILAVPLTTIASESTFSIGSRVLNKWKSSSIPENVEALITTRSWMYSFETNEDDGFFGSYVDWAAAPSVNCKQF
uniref:Uncharacterized protein n=1 Tax=Chenopodium quinoa TaxID=63459 RepID=A0A803MSV9_CHEQI